MTKREQYTSTRNRLAVLALFLLSFLGANRLRFRFSLSPIRLTALLGLILMAGSAWGQFGQDNMPLNYVPFYIEGPANGTGYTANDLTTHYYLCPTKEDWKYYDATANAVTNTPNGMPFLTTYQCLKPSSDYTTPNKAIWVFEKQSGADYRIKNVGENKYMTSHIAVLSNAGRMRIHLQETASDGALFTITYNNTYSCYRIKANGNVSDGYCYVNVNKGNKPSLTGSGEDVDNISTGGILGTYTNSANDGNFNFYIRIHPDYVAPTITAVDDNHYTITPAITLPEGFSIRYTTDGSLVPSPTNGTEYTSGTQIEITSTCILRAWVVGTLVSTPVMSVVAEQIVDLGVPVPTFAVLCENELEISCPGVVIDSIYYSINDSDPTGDAGTLYTEPITGLTDECDVSAVAYLNGTASAVETYTYYTNTDIPSHAINPGDSSVDPDKIKITFVQGATLYYTTDGSDPEMGASTTYEYTGESPALIDIDQDQDLEFRVVAKLPNRGASCPVKVVKRPKRPTFTAECICSGANRIHVFTLTSPTEAGKTYWCAVSNGDNHSAPASNTFVQCYTGVDINITDLPGYDGSSNIVTLHAYAKNADGNRSVIRSMVDNISMAGYTDAPTITCQTEGDVTTVTVTPPSTAPDATILIYDNGDAVLTNPFTITNGYTHVITATAQDDGEVESCEATKIIHLPIPITTLQEISAHGLDHAYILSADIEITGDFTTLGTFTGTLNGNYHTITNLGEPLFSKIDGGTVNNLILDNVGINGTGNVGAICSEADGAAKIYNCGILSGSVSGGTNTGGLVGLIAAGSSVRVVNCYNFADVSGSSYAAGIVGKNEGTVASNKTVGNVRIALCMMYGNVTDADIISPVYCGNHVNNVLNFTEYNYWRYRSGLTYTPGHYNDQMAIDMDDFLTRFPFYTHILNTHREMAAFFLFGGVNCDNVGDISADDIAEMGHWVLKKDVADYPIIEPWPTNTKKVLDAPVPSNILTEMGGSDHPGYLNITVIIGSNIYTESASGQHYQLPITDMDEANYDYTWGKVVLPFASEFEENTNYSKICTGWKIISVSPASEESFVNYNVSNRDCTTKDLYNTTGFIFAQGGNFIVPYGVTDITIEANFANAFYLSDEGYDIAYEKDKPGSASTIAGYVTRTPLAGTTPSTYHDKRVYKSLTAVLGAMDNSGTTHAQAVVLVGNYHRDDESLASLTSKGYTIMSIDADNNQEPDYAVYSNNTQDRPAIPPTRFDFVAFIPLGMAAHVTNTKFFPNTPIWKPRGWFEITETGLMFANQFEIESSNFNTSESDTRNYRCIINGGYFTQMVRSRQNHCRKLQYYQIGGKAYVKEFYPGNHSANQYANTLVPVNVTGGEIEQCFMTGYGKGTVYGTDIFFWCAGGKIHKFLASYMEKPRQSDDSDGNVNMTAKIDHAIIGRFFGGGTTAKARITGNIDVTVNNSRVDFYCGGPEFGDMSTGKTVTTHATNTTFGEYYGAGFGGTAITYRNDKDDANVTLSSSVSYPSGSSGYFNQYYCGSNGRLRYVENLGIGNCYKFEYLMHSRGHRGVARFYTGFASFSLATTGAVTNVLDNCTILNSFYGAGCQGMVAGTVTSTLTDCTVLGSAFGGGYKAAANEVPVYPTTEPSPISVFKAETGIFSDFGTVEPETYTWAQGTQAQNNTADATSHKLFTGTDVTLTDLGNVTGDIKITLNGNTTVNGSVFGGGNESKSLSNTLVEILEQTKVFGNIYGGGNMAEVEGNTKVIVNGRSSGSNTSTDPSSGPTGD